MRRDRESRFQASHVFAPGRSGSGSQLRLSYKIYKLQFKSRYIHKLTIIITYWLLPNNMELIDTRRQVDTNKITLS